MAIKVDLCLRDRFLLGEGAPNGVRLPMAADMDADRCGHVSGHVDQAMSIYYSRIPPVLVGCGCVILIIGAAKAQRQAMMMPKATP